MVQPKILVGDSAGCIGFRMLKPVLRAGCGSAAGNLLLCTGEIAG